MNLSELEKRLLSLNLDQLREESISLGLSWVGHKQRLIKRILNHHLSVVR